MTAPLFIKLNRNRNTKFQCDDSVDTFQTNARTDDFKSIWAVNKGREVTVLNMIDTHNSAVLGAFSGSSPLSLRLPRGDFDTLAECGLLQGRRATSRQLSPTRLWVAPRSGSSSHTDRRYFSQILIDTDANRCTGPCLSICTHAHICTHTPLPIYS